MVIELDYCPPHKVPEWRKEGGKVIRYQWMTVNT